MSCDASWIKAFIFDMDGTLYISPFDWKYIKDRLGVKEGLILDYLDKLPPSKRKIKMRELETMEREAVFKGAPAPGAREILSEIKSKGMKIALLTNNSRGLTEFVLSQLEVNFDAVVCRDDGVWKPYPKAVELILDKLQVSPQESVYVGDNILDIKTAEKFPFYRIIIVNDSPQLQRQYRDKVIFLNNLIELKSLSLW